MTEEKDELGTNDTNNLKQCIYRKRTEDIPYVLPKDVPQLFEQMEDLRDHPKFKTGTRTPDQWYMYPLLFFKMLFLTCATNLYNLCDDAVEHILVDGTFSYCPQHFKQLYTIHIYRSGYYIPVVHVCLCHKSEAEYYMMWTLLEYLCLSVCGQVLKVKSLIIDYELAAINAAYRKFPGIQITGCRFHLSQSWYKFILQHKGYDFLTPYLDATSEVGKWLRTHFGLSFLPPAMVPDAFAMLYDLKPSTDASGKPVSDAFSDYLLENYILPTADFPPTLWARKVTDSRDPRTTNGPESFHRTYNSSFFAKHPNIYKVVFHLLRLQEKAFIIYTDLRNKLVKKQAKPEARKDEFILKVWNKYLDSNRTDEDLRIFLCALGHRYKGKKLGKEKEKNEK